LRIIIICLLIFSCSNINTNKSTVEQVPIPTSINSFFGNKPDIIRLDSTYIKEIDIWSQMISFTEKFSDLIDNEINHKSKIKSLSIELKKIKKETIPGKYKTSPIIGRIRVVNTYLQKIDSYLLEQETVEEYQMDLQILLESYNGLIFQINQRSKEITD
tara:strand:+ start:633 stop:1109 length:477 start_codon:yes stop_codon:yes gene_type:complete